MHHHNAKLTVDFKNAQLPFGSQQLVEREVHLWLLDMQHLPLPAVDAGVEKSADQIRFMQRFYLRLLLAAYLHKPAHTIKLAKTEYGKPYVDNQQKDTKPPVYFSLSHHDRFQLVGLCLNHPVGVDLESKARVLRKPMKLAKRYFHPSEYEYLNSLPEKQLAQHWLTLWTAKEAVVKATGGGIVSGLDRFSVLPDNGILDITVADEIPTDDPLHDLKLVQLQPCIDMLGALACEVNINAVRAWYIGPSGVEVCK